MFFSDRIIITFNSFPNEYQNIQVFTHSDLKMAFSFAIIGSTPAMTLSECQNDGILSLNVKKLLILHLVWKTNCILQCSSLFFIMQLILVLIWKYNLPKHGRTITQFFLGTVLNISAIR